MESTEIIDGYTYKTIFVNKHFVILKLDDESNYVYKKEEMPQEIECNDIVGSFYDKKNKKEFFKILKKFDVIENQKNYTEWIVFCLYNHTVCLYNLYDFSQKRYIADSQLELNANIGDIYYSTVKEGKDIYLFDKLKNEELNKHYRNMFLQQDLDAIIENQPRPSELERNIMKQYDQANIEIFNEKVKHNFTQVFEIYEKENELDDGIFVYSLYRIDQDDDNEYTATTLQLPKFARENDFVGITEEGKYQFDRITLINKYEQERNFFYQKYKGYKK